MKKSLVLEGGGFRCLFTAGVLDYMLDNKVEFDSVYGVSMSALVGANFISRQSKRNLNVLLELTKDKKYISIRNRILKGNLINWDDLFKELDRKYPFNYDMFNNSKTNFFVSIFNLKTGKVEYKDIIGDNNAFLYMKASASLPLFSKRVKINNDLYFDGGIIDSLPYEQAIDDGFEKTVLILTRSDRYRKKIQSGLWLLRLRYLRYPSLVKAIRKRHVRYNNLVEKALELEKEGKLYIIRPSKELELKRLERNKGKFIDAYNLGYMTMKENHTKLLNYFNNNRL